MRALRLIVFALASICILHAIDVQAQQGGSAIRGRVTDQQQAILPGVAIVVTHAESGTIRETVTGADGTFLVPGLVPGPYKIAALLQGFSRLTQDRPRPAHRRPRCRSIWRCASARWRRT